MSRTSRSSSGAGRGVRFSEDSGQPGSGAGAGVGIGVDMELMRAAIADQAAVQHQQQRQSQQYAQGRAPPQQPADGSPFQAGYSMGGQRPSAAGHGARDVGPFDRSPSDDGHGAGGPSSGRDEQQFRIGGDDKDRDEDGKSVMSERTESHMSMSEILEYEAPAEYKSTKERRPTAASIDPAHMPASPRLHHDNSAPQLRNPFAAPQGAAPQQQQMVLQQQQRPGPSPAQQNTRNIRGLELPARPAPAVSRQVSAGTAYGIASPPMPAYGVQSPRPGGAAGAGPGAGAFGALPPSSPFTPHVQHFDPLSSPSMVQPFSPRVTASGSVKSPMLKPALRGGAPDTGADAFRRANGSADSLERGAIGTQPGYPSQGGQYPAAAAAGANANGGTAGNGLAKTFMGIYGAIKGNAGGNGTPGQGIVGPSFHTHGSDDESDVSTLVGNSPTRDTFKGMYGKGSGSPGDSTAQLPVLPISAPPTPRVPRSGPVDGAAAAAAATAASASGRRDSFWEWQDDAMDDEDPRLTGLQRKSMQLKHARMQNFDHRRSSWSSETGDPTIKHTGRRRLSLGNLHLEFGDEDGGDGGYRAPRRKSFDRRKSATTISCHVSHVQQRQKFILKLSKALMMFGAPSHRIESQLNATAQVLEIDAQFVHFPGIVIASFGDIDQRSSETHFVKSSGSLVLGQLHEVHTIYRRVVHDECSVEDGANELSKLIKMKPIYGVWTRILIAAGLCFVIAPLSFGGSLVDACASACFGILLMFLQLRVAKNNAMYSNIFEISVAVIISFISRGLSTTNVFCYQAIASSGVVLVLPGYVILCGSLELASKNMIAGSVRMVYAIIYSLFLGFGIAIGSDLYFLLDPAARQSMYVPLTTSTSVSGSFTLTNETMPMWNGTFSFTNGTAESEGNSLKLGNINCLRDPHDPWWKASTTVWLNFLWVPVFSALLCMHNQQPWKSRELFVMIIIACVGFSANLMANHFIFSRSDVVSAIGSFVIGILGNAYSRIFRGTAFTAMAVAVLFLVPSGMAMAGGLAMTYKGTDGDLYSNGLSIGFRMVSVAIGITVGLFGSGLVVYSFGRKKGAALFAF